MLRSLRKEFPELDYKKAKYLYTKFSTYRKDYLAGTIIPGQPRPALYAWYYSAQGFIHHPVKRTLLLSFDFCLRLLKVDKFMDPRFFTLEKITEAHKAVEDGSDKYDNWHLPLIADITAIEKEIQKPLYDSITFPPGFGLRE
jgi:hypothetical protein